VAVLKSHGCQRGTKDEAPETPLVIGGCSWGACLWCGHVKDVCVRHGMCNRTN
jgi:hypothetical protein